MRALYALIIALTLTGTAEARYLKAHIGRFVTNIAGTQWINVEGAAIGFTPAASGDVWVVLLSARLLSDGTGADAEIRFLVNGTEQGHGGTENSASNKGSSWQQFYAITGTTARQDIGVQVRDASGPNRVMVEDLVVIAFQLPASADFHYAENPAVTAVPGGSFNGFLSLDVTPSSAGEYLVLAVANGSEAPSNAGIHMRLQDPSASSWPIDDDPGSPDRFFLNDRTPFRSFFLARTENMVLGSNPFTIEAYCGNGTGAEVQYQRIMAFRTDAFDSYEGVEDVANTSTASTTPVVKSTLTTAVPPASRDYITLQSLYLGAPSSSTNERRASFDRDGVAKSSYTHVMNSAAHRVPYAHFDARTTAGAATYENTFSSSNGAFTVSAKESVIHVLRLPTSDPAAEIGLEAFGNKGKGSNGGPGWGDFNDDGCLDVAVGSFDNVFGTTMLMQNESGGVCQGTFTDVTDCLGSGLRTDDGERHSLWGDVDNDGLLDFIRNTSNKIEIFLNNGFDATPPAGCPNWMPFGSGGAPSQTLADASVQPDFIGMNSEGLALIDYDRDGVLELITNMHDEGMVMFENDGTGTFTKVLLPGLPTSGTASGDYGVATDIDVDGDVDILQRLDGLADLYLNNDDGTFTVAAFDQPALNTNKGGVALCDFDNDGDFDMFWTEEGTNQVWEQTGVATFTPRGVPASFTGVVEGVACADIDNDGDVDFALTTNAEDQLFRNDGGFTFTDITPSFFGTNDGHGAAFADYDRDGDADLVIEQSGSLFLWKNPTNDSNYLTVRVLQDLDAIPGGITRDAIGATIELLSCDGVTASGIREVQGGHGHGSQDPAYVHIGLPTSGSPSGASGEYVVRVRFLDGTDIGKAIVPSSIGGYQLLTITSTDATDTTACSPTAVQLASFRAQGVASGVELTWQTASELDNLGFHVHRAESPEGPYHRVTSSPIPGLGSSPAGARYRYVDSGLADGSRYYYELEDIELGGARDFHGPVDAIAGGAAVEPRTHIRIGDATSSLSITAGRNVTDLVLVTGGFEATQRADGTVELNVETLTNQDGLPRLRTWIDARECRGAEIVSVKRRRRERYALQPTGTAATVEASPRGTVRAGRRRTELAAAGTATVLDLGYQGDARKAFVELSPFHWDADRGELVLTRELVVRVSFRRKQDCAKPALGKRSPLVRLAARERGLYAASLSELLPRKSKWDRLQLSRLGEPVAFHVDPTTGTLYFWSEGADLNPYEDQAVYELSLDGDGLQMPVDAGDAALAVVSTESLFEENRIYQAGLVEAPDLWLWDIVFANESKNFAFTLESISSGPGSIEIAIQGASRSTHMVRVAVNGLDVGAISWSGAIACERTLAIPAGILQPGANQLTLVNVDPSSMVLLDRFRIFYARARGDAVLIDITDSVPRWATAPRDGRTYFVASEAHRATTSSVPKRRLARGRAEYLIIAPSAWLDVTRPLLNRRRRQGLVSKAVSVESIYDEFGYGEARPEAIRDFLAHAYTSWKRAPHYVLLLGDGSYDFLDALETGTRNHVPPLILRTPYLWTASDPAYAAVHGDDPLPDLALGRLPAATRDEARSMIRKILAYEKSALSLASRIVLVADDADASGDFPGEANVLSSGELAGLDVTQILLGEVDASAMRPEIKTAFDEGASLMSYMGHGGIHLWADENIFNIADVSELEPQSRQPIVLTLNCLNGFFHFPYFDSLAESMVKAEGRGAVAVISPSGLSLHGEAKLFHRAILRELLAGHERLGDAWLAAQESAPSPELLAIYHLFGDPAMKLR